MLPSPSEITRNEWARPMNIHLIYYAKGHYGKTENLLDDLATVIAKWSLMPVDCITPRDILECLYDVWMDVAEEHMRQVLMKEIFFGGYRDQCVAGIGNVEDTIKILHSNIRHCDPKYLTEEKWPGFKIRCVDGEPEAVNELDLPPEVIKEHTDSLRGKS